MILGCLGCSANAADIAVTVAGKRASIPAPHITKTEDNIRLNQNIPFLFLTEHA